MNPKTDYTTLFITGALAVIAGLFVGDGFSATAQFFAGMAVGIGIGAIIIGFVVYIRQARP
jgi:hypothetical protein